MGRASSINNADSAGNKIKEIVMRQITLPRRSAHSLTPSNSTVTVPAQHACLCPMQIAQCTQQCTPRYCVQAIHANVLVQPCLDSCSGCAACSALLCSLPSSARTRCSCASCLLMQPLGGVSWRLRHARPTPAAPVSNTSCKHTTSQSKPQCQVSCQASKSVWNVNGPRGGQLSD